MKKKIIRQEWNELSRKSKGIWNDWCRKVRNEECAYRSNFGDYINLPDIGTMIEFLVENIKIDGAKPGSLIDIGIHERDCPEDMR